MFVPQRNEGTRKRRTFMVFLFTKIVVIRNERQAQLVLQTQTKAVVCRESDASTDFGHDAVSEVLLATGIHPRTGCPLKIRPEVHIKPFVGEFGAHGNTEIGAITRHSDGFVGSVITFDARQQRPMSVETVFGINANISAICSIDKMVFRDVQEIQCRTDVGVWDDRPSLRVLSRGRQHAAQQAHYQCYSFHNVMICV